MSEVKLRGRRVVVSSVDSILGASLADAFADLGFELESVPSRRRRRPVEVLALVPSDAVVASRQSVPRLAREIERFVRLSRSIAREMCGFGAGRILAVVPPCSDDCDLDADFVRRAYLSFAAALGNGVREHGVTVTVACPGINSAATRRETALAIAAQTIDGREFVTF